MITYKDKLDIIVLAGQSNAEGNGVSFDDCIETRNDVLELVDANHYYLDCTDIHHPIVRCKLPVECKIRCLQERMENDVAKHDLSFTFSDEYKKHGYLEEGRRLMVVKAAVNGTGFSLKQHGLHHFLYDRLLDMVDYALSLNPENRIVAYCWHQGEHDAFEQAWLTKQERYDFYCNEFLAQTNDFLNRYSQFSIPIISGEFCNEWANLPENAVQCEAVENALKDCMEQIGYAAFVSSKGLSSNDAFLHNGDNIHFCKSSIQELGRRYFTAFDKLCHTKQ